MSGFTARSFEERLAAAEPAGERRRPRIGDSVTAEIERRVLSPIETAMPAAAPIVEAVRRCGGCTHARHQLGSDEPHPDPGSVV